MAQWSKWRAMRRSVPERAIPHQLALFIFSSSFLDPVEDLTPVQITSHPMPAMFCAFGLYKYNRTDWNPDEWLDECWLWLNMLHLELDPFLLTVKLTSTARKIISDTLFLGTKASRFCTQKSSLIHQTINMGQKKTNSYTMDEIQNSNSFEGAEDSQRQRKCRCKSNYRLRSRFIYVPQSFYQLVM